MIIASVLFGLLFFALILGYFAFKKDTYPTPQEPKVDAPSDPKPISDPLPSDGKII